MLANNEKLAQIVAAKTTTVDDVIAALQNLDRELSNDDGLKWFNLLYLKVTEGVRHQSANMRWENVAWRAARCDLCEALFSRRGELAQQSH